MPHVLPLEYKTASAKLIINDDGSTRLVNVYSKTRGLGHATELMNIVLEYVDTKNVRIDLEVKRYGNQIEGSMNNRELVDFYSKFGFEKVSMRDPILMTRPPKINSQE